MSPDFFVEYQQFFLAFHVLGAVLGMGGATMADLLFFNFLKDFRITKKEAEILGLLSNVILSAMFLLFVTGLALYLSDVPRFSTSPTFFGKMAIVAVLIINGVLMHTYVAPVMIHISFRKKDFKPGHAMHKLRAIAFAMGSISISSWYIVFFLAMLKTHVPEWIGHGHILGAYFAVIACAVAGSQIVRLALQRKYLFSGK